MHIAEYESVDPLSVLQLNTLALDFALTPEHVAHLRRSDPRLFPFFAIYAVENDQVIGQAGIFRLPMVSKEGREDVGTVWALCIHPHHTERGISSLLLDEAHVRMREAGLRFSTLGTNRYHLAYKLYQKHGYEDMQILATAMARWETAHQPTRLKAQLPGPEGFDLIERIFQDVSSNYLGHAWRHTPFAPLRDKTNLEDMWVLWQNNSPVGYAHTYANKTMLNINNLLLYEGIDVTEAVAAVVAELKTLYVKVKVNRPVDILGLQCSGYKVAHPTPCAYMIKPLVTGMSIEEARTLFGIGTDRFLISWFDFV